MQREKIFAFTTKNAETLAFVLVSNPKLLATNLSAHSENRAEFVEELTYWLNSSDLANVLTQQLYRLNNSLKRNRIWGSNKVVASLVNVNLPFDEDTYEKALFGGTTEISRKFLLVLQRTYTNLLLSSMGSLPEDFAVFDAIYGRPKFIKC